MAEASLGGRRVLITRPAGQSAALCRRVEAAGGRAVAIPATAITDVANRNATQGLEEEGDWDLVIFVSRNAVEHAHRLAPRFFQAPGNCTVYAVGEGTRLELQRHGIEEVHAPDQGAGGEALLRLPGLQKQAVQGARVLIVRGEGGREELRQELERRGAIVQYAEVYRRVPPPTGPMAALWSAGGPDIIVATSTQGLENLVKTTPALFRRKLFSTPLAVMSARIRDRAEALGFDAPVAVAPAAGDAGLMAAIHNLVEGPR